MTTDQFWDIIARVDDASDGEMDQKCNLLGEYLGRLPAEEVQSFSEHFDEIDEDSGFHEGYQYVVDEVHEKLTGKAATRTKPHPESPSGIEFDEERVAERYPGLAGKHGY